MAALDRERAKLLSLFVSGNSEAGAASYLRAEIDRRSDEMTEIGHKLESAKALNIPTDEAKIINELKKQIGKIREDLSQSDAEAARAREIVRSLIDKVTIHPIGLQKGKGAGAARIVFEGQICRLLGTSVEMDSRDGILSALGTQCRQYPIATTWRLTLLTGFNTAANRQAVSTTRLDTIYSEEPAKARSEPAKARLRYKSRSARR